MGLTSSSTRGRRFILVVLVLISVTIITADVKGGSSHIVSGLKSYARDALRPVRQGINAVVQPIDSFFVGAVDYRSVVSANQRLRQENAVLQRRLLERDGAASELETLLREEHLPWAKGIKKVPAEVVADSISNFVDTVQLDKGRDNGVGVGMPVVGGSGLVGRVIEASHTTSTVLLISDPSSGVGVRLGRGGTIGLARGQGADRSLKVDYVAPFTKVKKGEIAYTSGLQNSLYPPGIPVGRVVQAHSSSNSLQESITLQPLAALGQLQFVDVLEWQTPP